MKKVLFALLSIFILGNAYAYQAVKIADDTTPGNAASPGTPSTPDQGTVNQGTNGMNQGSATPGTNQGTDMGTAGTDMGTVGTTSGPAED